MPIDFSLSEEQELICRTVEDFARAELREQMRAHEAAGGLSERTRRLAHELGLDRLNLPEAHGGHGADERLLALVNERLAWGDAGAAVALATWQPVLAALAALGGGDAGGAARWYERVAALTESPSRAAVAFSERLDTELPAAGFGCRAERRGGAYRLTGRKAFVTLAEGAALTLVAAQAEEGPAVFAVEGAPEGLRTEPLAPRTGLQAAPLYDLVLDGVEVPAESRLPGEDITGALRHFFARAAVQQAARCVGVMAAAWTTARDYAAEREAFGKPIAHFQAIAFMLADMATLTDASRWSVWQAAHALDAGGKRALRDAHCAVANAYAAAREVTEQAVQILGGAGFVEDYPAEKWMREARALTLGWGTDELALSVVAHELLDTADDAEPEALLPMPQAQPVTT